MKRYDEFSHTSEEIDEHFAIIERRSMDRIALLYATHKTFMDEYCSDPYYPEYNHGLYNEMNSNSLFSEDDSITSTCDEVQDDLNHEEYNEDIQEYDYTINNQEVLSSENMLQSDHSILHYDSEYHQCPSQSSPIHSSTHEDYIQRECVNPKIVLSEDNDNGEEYVYTSTLKSYSSEDDTNAHIILHDQDKEDIISEIRLIISKSSKYSDSESSRRTPQIHFKHVLNELLQKTRTTPNDIYLSLPNYFPPPKVSRSTYLPNADIIICFNFIVHRLDMREIHRQIVEQYNKVSNKVFISDDSEMLHIGKDDPSHHCSPSKDDFSSCSVHAPVSITEKETR